MGTTSEKRLGMVPCRVRGNILVRRSRSQCGAVAVEFALIIPIFLVLLFGMIDFGIALMRLHRPSRRLKGGFPSGNSGLTLNETMLATNRFNVAGEGDFVMKISEPPQASPRALDVWLEF